LINVQSLKKVDKKAYGLVLYDEADKFLSSTNYRKELCSLQSYYSYAVTGTVKLNGYPDNMFPMFYGKKEELILKNMIPTYISVPTQFDTLSFDNFAEIETLLYENTERNKLIVDTLDRAMKSHNKAIVFSKRVEHAKTLKTMLEAKGHKVFMLI
jgi:superfamily II DNA or RNA helicase